MTDSPLDRFDWEWIKFSIERRDAGIIWATRWVDIWQGKPAKIELPMHAPIVKSSYPML